VLRRDGGTGAGTSQGADWKEAQGLGQAPVPENRLYSYRACGVEQRNFWFLCSVIAEMPGEKVRANGARHIRPGQRPGFKMNNKNVR